LDLDVSDISLRKFAIVAAIGVTLAGCSREPTGREVGSIIGATAGIFLGSQIGSGVGRAMNLARLLPGLIRIPVLLVKLPLDLPSQKMQARRQKNNVALLKWLSLLRGRILDTPIELLVANPMEIGKF
jgi:hypothetical protein